MGLKEYFLFFTRGIRLMIQYLKSIFRHTVYRYKYPKSLRNAYQLIYVDPNEINDVVVPSHRKNRKCGTYIDDGAWDKNTPNKFFNRWEKSVMPLKNYEFYNSVRKYIQNDVEWEMTEFGSYSSDPKYNSKTIDQIHSSLEKDGYLTQKQLRAQQNTVKNFILPPPENHEVAVVIGRDGKIIFDEGKHRFVVARLIGIPRIPVHVVVRHKRWQSIREEVASCRNINNLDEDIKDMLDHPDLKPLLTHDSQ
jgi:hypothetical protein